MDDKTAEKQVEQESPNAAPERKGLFQGGNLVLVILGAIVAAGFAALIIWISIGAPPKEEKRKSGRRRNQGRRQARVQRGRQTLPRDPSRAQARVP